VLRHDAARLELDQAEREPLAVNGSARDPLPDLLRLLLAGFLESAQSAIVP
jgi:hypothetical protein